MAAQMGLPKAVLLLGAGFTGSILMRNGKLADILGDLRALFKNMEGSGGSSDAETSVVAAQLDRLVTEVQRMAAARPVTVFSGNSSQEGNLSSLIVPASSLGALGYGYMWLKGLSFSELMYVTKSNIAGAVSNMTINLVQLSDFLAATKRHLVQRMKTVDDKVKEQKKISEDIKNEVTGVRGKLMDMGNDLHSLHHLVCSLDGKASAIEDKQNHTNAGVAYLLGFIHQKGGNVTNLRQDDSKTKGKRGFIGYTEATSLKGLQHFALEPGSCSKSGTNATFQAIIDPPAA